MDETGWDVYLYFGFTAAMVAVLYGTVYHYYFGHGRKTSEDAKYSMMEDDD
jgi:cbb3-type cytochrome oxidase subunit 3